jgi:hypothetical protein
VGPRKIYAIYYSVPRNIPYFPVVTDKFAEISKKNIYPHHLGSSGYVGKVGESKKKLQVLANLIR